MSNRELAELFNVRSHNPSFFSVKNKIETRTELLDFCIPVNLHFPPPEVLELVRANLSEILRYYPDYLEVHQQHLARITGLVTETIVPCNGSTEIITTLCHIAEPPLVTSIPTFSRWTDLPEELGTPFHTVQRRRDQQFRLEVDEIVSVVRKVNAATLIISNPNNPTGSWMTHAEVRRLVESLADLKTVIIDESFIDFSSLRSVAPDVCTYPNLIVVKSLGKSLGWHGVRLGYAATNPTRARKLREGLPFWNINGLAAFVLKTVTQFPQLYRESFSQVSRDRDYMIKKLSSVEGLTIFPSKANFLFVELPERVSGKQLRDRLLTQHGIIVRECSNKIGSSEQYLRLAVQRKEAVDILIPALNEELRSSLVSVPLAR